MITKEHESWRKRIAEESLINQIHENGGLMPAGDIGPDRYRYYVGFLAGMAAEHDVAKLMGRIEAVEYCDVERVANLAGMKAQLAALLRTDE